MDLDKKRLDARKCISNRYARVRIRASVDDDGGGAVQASRVNAVDDSTFVVGLESLESKPELFALFSRFAFDGS